MPPTGYDMKQDGSSTYGFCVFSFNDMSKFFTISAIHAFDCIVANRIPINNYSKENFKTLLT